MWQWPSPGQVPQVGSLGVRLYKKTDQPEGKGEKWGWLCRHGAPLWPALCQGLSRPPVSSSLEGRRHACAVPVLELRVWAQRTVTCPGFHSWH